MYVAKLILCCLAVVLISSASTTKVLLSDRQCDDVKYRCGFQHPDDYFRFKEGTEAMITEYPWLARLRYKTEGDNYEESLCNGALISSRHVLTAAHCQFNDAILTTVRLGEYSLYLTDECVNYIDLDAKECTKEKDIKVESFIPHPGYNGVPDGIHDVALIVLSKEVKSTDYIRPVCLPWPKVTRPKVDEDLLVAGWGWKKSVTTYDVLEIKQRLAVKINSEAACNAEGTKLQQNQMCGTRSNIDVCIFEDGGPLTFSYKHRWYIEGIALGHDRICIGAAPRLVYVKVADYLDWIEENVGTIME